MSPRNSPPGQIGRFRWLRIEPLENRLCLSGSPIVTPNSPDLTLVDSDSGAYQASGAGAEAVPGGVTAAQRDFSRAAEAINRFALDLYQHFQPQEGNLFLSPMSIVTALAMTYAGARGGTASQMADVLHLGEGDGVHESFRALLDVLDPADDARPFDLDVANALWPQEGFPFRDEFLQLVQTQYGGGAQSLEYRFDAPREEARQTINDWVEENTNDKIQDLIPKGALNKFTRMVLTNAIYFKGQWETEFDPKLTKDRPFHLESGEAVDVPTMNLRSQFRYSEQDGFQVLNMPYKGGDLSMTILLPQRGDSMPYKGGDLSMAILLPQRGDSFSFNTDLQSASAHSPTEPAADLADLSADTLAKVTQWLDGSSGRREVDVRLPKFETTVSSSLKDVLKGMGMPDAFNKHSANFNGMANLRPDERLFISEVLHKAFVEVNEEGTEAAAATAVIVDWTTCFAAGTPVLTPQGPKPIEEIVPGDRVLSRHERDVNSPIEGKLVEETFVRQGETLDLHVGGRVVRTTREHPFYVRDRGWTPAGKLQVGDPVATDGDRWIEVEKVVDTGRTETVYNFRVTDYHTYFVGGGEWGFGVWAHNMCGGTPDPTVQFNADHPFHFFIRDNQTGAMLFMGRMSDPLQEENLDLKPQFVAEEGEREEVGDPVEEVGVEKTPPHDPVGEAPLELDARWPMLGEQTVADLAYAFATQTQQNRDRDGDRLSKDNDVELLAWLELAQI